MRVSALALMVAAALAPRPVAAQSLGAVAQQEEARRAEVKQPAKAYSNADVPGSPSGHATTSGDEGAPPQGYVSKSTGKVMTADEMVNSSKALLSDQEEKANEPYWRDRAKGIRAEVEKARALVDVLSKAENVDSPTQAEALKKARAVMEQAEARLARFETQAEVARIPKAWIQ